MEGPIGGSSRRRQRNVSETLLFSIGKVCSWKLKYLVEQVLCSSIDEDSVSDSFTISKLSSSQFHHQSDKVSIFSISFCSFLTD